MPPKTVAVVSAVSVTIGWLLASMLTPPVARLQSLPETRPTPAAAVADPATAYAELVLNQRAAPKPPQPRRNPFVFESRSAGPTRAVTPQMELPRPQPVRPTYRLSGIGISETADGVVRTAVLSDSVTVHLVKAGDTIGGFTIGEVTDSDVVLIDASGVRFVIRLR